MIIQPPLTRLLELKVHKVPKGLRVFKVR